MKYKDKSSLLKSSVGLALLLGCASCSDTFNDHFDLNGNTETATLWEKIQADPELSDFAALCERIHYRKNENDLSTSTTYADLLNQGVEYTVFAPINSALEGSKWLTAEDNYTTVAQFMNNHIALYSNLNRDETDAELTLLNKKESVWNMVDKTLSNQPLTSVNIAAGNGVLHKLGAINPFKYNLYEYIESDSDLDSLNAFLKDTEYKELTSYVQGPTVNGQVTYLEVDSTTYNAAFYNTRAYFNREDSLYVMVVPTNEAWGKALEKTKKLYNYRKKYYDTDGNLVSEINGDSLATLYSRMALIQNNIFNMNLRKDIPLEQYGKIAKSDSLESTTGNVYYGDEINPLFANTTLVDGLSNGYLFKSNDYSFWESWQPERYVNVTSYNIDDNNTKNVYSQSSVTFSYKGVDKVTGDSTTIYTNGYYFQPSSNTSYTEVGIKLRNVLSGTYDIYAVVLPDIGNSVEDRKPIYVRPYILWTDNEEKGKITNSGSGIYGAYTGNFKRDESAMENFTYKNSSGAVPCAKDEDGNDIIEISSVEQPDSVLLFKHVTFPYCCYGLGDDSYPVVKLQSRVPTKQRAFFTNHFYIAGIYLKPCKDEE
jgi:hypothetical protein